MYRLAFASLALCLAPSAFAQDAMTQLGAHVHGASTLSIAADPASGQLTLEMEGPAYNVYGFERAPQSPEEIALVARVHASLTQASPVSLTAAAGCVWQSAEVIGGPAQSESGHDHGSHGDDEHDHHDHGHEAHDHHDHGDDHDAHDHDAHRHDHEAEHHNDHGHDHGHGHDAHNDHGSEEDEGHGHSEVLLRWNFQCENADVLEQVDATGLFERMGGLETLDAQFFDGERAAAADLTPVRPVIQLG